MAPNVKAQTAAPLPPKIVKLQKKMARASGSKKKLNRSRAGNALLFIVMGICGVFMALPLVMIVNNALKPLDEIYQFPPRIFVRNPTLSNFSDLFVLMNESWVPFSRYVFNTLIITLGGMAGHVIIASMAAFVLAKYDFPGARLFFSIVVTALMFTGYVTGIPNYIIMSRLKMIDTHWAVILPAFAAPIGLFLMKQTMESLPTALIEAAHIDGAGEFRIFFQIAFPCIRPGLLTLCLLQFLWSWNSYMYPLVFINKQANYTIPIFVKSLASAFRTDYGAQLAGLTLSTIPILILFGLGSKTFIRGLTAGAVKG